MRVWVMMGRGATTGPRRAPDAHEHWPRDRGPIHDRGASIALAGAIPVLYVALAIVLFRRVWADPSTHSIGTSSDPPQFMWFLSWTAFALTHGHNPLVSTYIDYPGGINLMWNTSLLLPGAVVAPVTLHWGPVVAYNLLLTLAPALSAWAAYLALCRLTASPPAALVGGLLYGFSPFLLTEALAHPQMALAPAPPLVLLLGHELLCRRHWPAPVVGAALGVLAAIQLLSGEELLATTAVVALLAGLLLVVIRGVRTGGGMVWRRLLSVASTALAVFAVLAALPLATQFAGPQVVHGLVHADTTTVYVTDLFGLVVPSPLQWLVSPAAWALGPHLRLPLVEQTGYLGAPLLLLLAATVAVWWRRVVVRWAGLVFVVVTLLSAGPHLEVAGHLTALPLPGALLGRLPVLRDALPSRLMVFADLTAALLVTLVLAHLPQLTARRQWLTGAVVGLALLPLLPTPAYPATAVRVPAFFQGRLLARIPPRSVALVAPFAAPYLSRYHDGPYSRAMLWQAVAGLRFRMPEGYAFVPQADGTAALHPPASALQTAMVAIQGGSRLPALTAHVRRALLHDLQRWRVQTIIVGPMGNRQTLLALFRHLLDRPPVAVQGVAMWWHVALNGSARPTHRSELDRSSRLARACYVLFCPQSDGLAMRDALERRLTLLTPIRSRPAGGCPTIFACEDAFSAQYTRCRIVRAHSVALLTVIVHNRLSRRQVPDGVCVPW